MIQSTHEAVGSTNSINTEVGLREKTFAMAQAGGSFRERRGHSYGVSLREEPEVIDRKLAHFLVSRRIPLNDPG